MDVDVGYDVGAAKASTHGRKNSCPVGLRSGANNCDPGEKRGGERWSPWERSRQQRGELKECNWCRGKPMDHGRRRVEEDGEVKAKRSATGIVNGLDGNGTQA